LLKNAVGFMRCCFD